MGVRNGLSSRLHNFWAQTDCPELIRLPAVTKWGPFRCSAYPDASTQGSTGVRVTSAQT